MKPRTLAIWAAVLPMIALHVSFLISASAEIVPWCIPHLDGCTSISRAARHGYALFFFRAIMMPFSVVLAIYWVMAYQWLRNLGDLHSCRPRVMKILGFIGALSLVVYVDFLGTQGSGYRLMRRYGIIFFFLFTAFSQLLFISRLYALESDTINSLKRIRSFKFGVALLQVLIALLHICVSLFLEERDAAQNILEWNSGVLLAVFSLGTAAAWSKTGFSVDFLNAKQ